MKTALLVGINYPNTSHELRGCVNDVLTMKSILETHYNFDFIKVIIDNEATTANMIAAMEGLVCGCKDGDILYFHYSGHGSQIYHGPDPDTEEDGLDEIICPIDLDWDTKVIRDDDMKKIFDKVGAGVHFTVVLDCCHSGDGMDHRGSYQPSSRVFTGDEPLPKGARNRFLAPPSEVLVKNKHIQYTKTRSLQSRNIDDTGMMVSGCRFHQTSADASIDGKYMGACTHFLSKTLADYNYNISYKTLTDELNSRLGQYGFTQQPELNGAKRNFETAFLHPLENGPAENKIVKKDWWQRFKEWLKKIKYLLVN